MPIPPFDIVSIGVLWDNVPRIVEFPVVSFDAFQPHGIREEDQWREFLSRVRRWFFFEYPFPTVQWGKVDNVDELEDWLSRVSLAAGRLDRSQARSLANGALLLIHIARRYRMIPAIGLPYGDGFLAARSWLSACWDKHVFALARDFQSVDMRLTTHPHRLTRAGVPHRPDDESSSETSSTYDTPSRSLNLPNFSAFV